MIGHQPKMLIISSATERNLQLQRLESVVRSRKIKMKCPIWESQVVTSSHMDPDTAKISSGVFV